MKKLTALFIASIIAALSFGCSNGDENIPDDTTNSIHDTVADTIADESSHDTETAFIPNTNLSRGVIEGDVYTNECLGFSFTKPETWEYSPDNKLARSMNLEPEKMNLHIEQLLEKRDVVYDMVVADPKTRTNISIEFENLSRTFDVDITEDHYIDVLQQKISGVTNMAASFYDSVAEVTFGENTYKRVAYSAVTASGIPMIQAHYIRKIDGYISYITVTIMGGYDLYEIEAMFS